MTGEVNIGHSILVFERIIYSFMGEYQSGALFIFLSFERSIILNTLLQLIEREQNLVNKREKNFNDRVQMLYKLDEDHSLSDDEQNKLKDKIASSKSYEEELDTEIKQVRISMKRYILKLMEL